MQRICSTARYQKERKLRVVASLEGLKGMKHWERNPPSGQVDQNGTNYQEEGNPCRPIEKDLYERQFPVGGAAVDEVHQFLVVRNRDSGE